MTAENSEPEEVGAESADEFAVLNIDDLGDQGSLNEEDRKALAEGSQRLAETVSRALSTTQFDPGKRLNQMVQRAAMPRALESTDRLGKLVSAAVMPRMMDGKKLSSVLAGVDSTRWMKSILSSSGLAN